MAGNRSLKADINGVIGASGSGKTSHVMAEIKRRKAKRVLIWDTKGEFTAEGYGQAVYKLAEVIAIMRKAGKSGAFKIAYQPRGDEIALKKQFDLFCYAAFAAKNLVMVCEELAEVTTATHAPAGWRKCTTQGRTEGLIIYGLSQTPAQIDKNFFGNCSKVRTGRLNFENHVRAMANCMRVTREEITALADGHYIERDMRTGELTRGALF